MQKVRKNSLKYLYGLLSSLLIIGYSSQSYSQTNRKYAGKYTYKSYRYFESLTLKENGQFDYECNKELSREKLSGNWQLRNNEIVLDSYPQRDRLLVYESFRKGLKHKIIYVYNKQYESIPYTIIATKFRSDSVILKDQWKYSTLDNLTKSFYLIDNQGLTSPSYIIQGSRTNVIKCLFETRRIFENELWEITEYGVIPKNEAGEVQRYLLRKTQ